MDPNNTPALQPPPGQVTNLSDPYSLRSDMYVAAGVGLGVSSLAVILRVFTKVRVLRSMQLEEYILLLSLLGFFAFTFLMIHAVHLGQGTHQWNVSVAHLQQVIQVRCMPQLKVFPNTTAKGLIHSLPTPLRLYIVPSF